jgi:beta-1,4-mannosyl-glycoprotein beta-1,4-N-acetylglucosaminyltransferase
MKVYDVFPFFNELDLLEIRLQELSNVVDYFVLVESNVTFTGNPKEYLFENNKERFSAYLNKIRYIKVDDTPETTDPWVREKFQRAAGSRGLFDAVPEDIIIVSDCDEIPRAEMIEMIKEDENNYERYLLHIPQFNFKLNYMKFLEKGHHRQIVVTRFKAFSNPQQEREHTFFWNPVGANSVEVHHGGWHFTFMGGDQSCITKFNSYSHTEVNVPAVVDNFNTNWMIRNKYGFEEGLRTDDNKERFEYVVIDEYFPEYIRNNLTKYQDWIIPNALFHVEDLYREPNTDQGQ